MRRRWFAAVLVAVVTLAGCSSVVSGHGRSVVPPVAPDAELPVVGDSGGQFDQLVKNSLSDAIKFWTASYPAVSGGTPFPPLKGKLYSVAGFDVTAADKQNACIAKHPTSVVDNAFYCSLDDSVAWDRDAQHLVPALGSKYGSFLVAMVFAHEFGHVVQGRLGILAQDRATILDESQADCAAGAFVAWALKFDAPHFRPTSSTLDEALAGYLLVRDSTPEDTSEISHGNGFDRLAALSDGIDHGAAYCYSADWVKRQFTERPFTTDADLQAGGNESLAQVLNPAPTQQNGTGGGGLQPSLNDFWSTAAKSIGKSFEPVKIAQADHPPCDDKSQFDYCPDDNTIYYSDSFASSAYNSLAVLAIDKQTADVTVRQNQPADYALGTMFAYGWGLAVRHQLFNRSLDDKDALVAAGCYAGAYSRSVNSPDISGFALSPPDMDEATTAVLSEVSSNDAFGGRGTTGLDRINSFTKGYFGGLSAC